MKCLCSKFLFLFFMSNRPFFDEERWTKPFFHWIKGNEKKTLRRFKKTIVIAEEPKEWNRLFSASCYDELLLIIHYNPDNPTSVLHLTPKLIILVYRIFSTMPDRCNVHVFLIVCLRYLRCLNSDIYLKMAANFLCDFPLECENVAPLIVFWASQSTWIPHKWY